MTSRSRLHLPGSLRNSRVRTLFWLALGVVALAAVVFAASALSSPRDQVPQLPSASTDLSPQEQSQRDYQAATKAAKSGDDKKAAGLLEKAVKEDPSNYAARQKLQEIDPAAAATLDPAKQTQPGRKTEPPAQGGKNPPAAAQWYDLPVADLGKLLPASVTGFRTGNREVSAGDAEVPLDPGSSAMSVRVTRVLLLVHDRGSAAAARQFVNSHMKLYPKANDAVVAGGTGATFGSDGRHYGAVVFSRGRFAYEVIMTAPAGDPAKLKDLGDQIADAFPSKP